MTGFFLILTVVLGTVLLACLGAQPPAVRRAPVRVRDDHGHENTPGGGH